MPKQVKYCIHHPDVVATETCSVCEKPICFNCKHEFLGKHYCSAKCFIFYTLKSTGRYTIQFIQNFFKIIFWPLKQIFSSEKTNWANFILILCILFCFYFVIKMNREIKTLQSSDNNSTTIPAVIDTTNLPTVQIFKPSEGGMVSSNTITIEGQAEENRILALTVNGKLDRVLLPQKETFQFKNIKLKRGDNQIEIRAISPDGKVTILETLNFKYATPTLNYLAKEIKRGPANERTVALTFDGGSINNAADEILNVLKKEEVKSTFFLTGKFIRQYPQTVKRIINEGHEVGNHTWSHPKFTSFEENWKHQTLEGVDEIKVKQELTKAAAIFKVVTGKDMVGLWRAPYGYYNQEILKWAASAGYKHIGWTVGRGWEENMDTLDWVKDKDSKAYHTADEIAQKILNYADKKGQGANGAIILMHLGTLREDDFPHEKLPEIIQGLKKRKYELVTVSEMIHFE